MSNVDLPRPLEAYFAHAELPGTEQLRRFTITLPCFDGARLDRLQWWWTASAGQLRVVGEAGLAQLREEATRRFRQHIEHWLVNHGRRLAGADPIPRLEAQARALAAPAPETNATPASDLRVVNSR